MGILSKTEKKALKKKYLADEKEELRKRLILDKKELLSLIRYLDKHLSEVPCDRSLKNVEKWAEKHKIDFADLEISLIDLGGGCDCEVVNNIEPERFF